MANEVQRWSFSGSYTAPVQNVWEISLGGATGGTYTLSVNSTVTGDIDLTDTGLQTALEAVVGMGNVTVSGAGPFTATFSLVAGSVSMTLNSDSTDGTVSVSETTPFYEGSQTTWSWNSNSVVYRFYVDDPQDVAEELIGAGNVTVISAGSGTFDFEFTGDYANTDVDEIVATPDNYAGTSEFTTLIEGGSGGDTHHTASGGISLAGFAARTISVATSGGITLAGSATANTLTDGLIDAWLLNSNLLGKTGRAALIYSGTASYTTGKVLNGFQFDGTNYLDLAASQNTMNMSGDRTISFWINFASIAADQIIMGDWGASAATQYWRIYFDHAWYVGGEPTIGLRLSNGSSEASPISNTTITANTWYWVCVRYNSTTHEVKMSTLHSGGGGTNSMTYAPQSRNSAFRIGAAHDGSSPLSNGTKLDAIHVWDRYLTDEETNVVYNSYAGWEYLNGASHVASGGVALGGTYQNSRNYTLKAFTSRLVGFPLLVLCEHENAKFFDEDNHELPSEARDDDLYAVQVTLETEAQTIQARF